MCVCTHGMPTAHSHTYVIHTCMHAHIHTYIHTYIHAYIHTYIHTQQTITHGTHSHIRNASNRTDLQSHTLNSIVSPCVLFSVPACWLKALFHLQAVPFFPNLPLRPPRLLATTSSRLSWPPTPLSSTQPCRTSCSLQPTPAAPP